jgi:two-component system, response regulator FlrC
VTAYSAPGFLVPDDLESSFPPAGDDPGRVASFPSQRQRPAAGDGLIYRDPAMLAVVQRAQRIARSDASVLVQGESGTGKEVIARYIHRNSPRANGPFVAVNCAAIPEQLLESELFGHERGAFSGALGQRIGKLEAAQNGTILLDEISEMDRRLQAKLLRALQEREIDRIGGRAPIRLNVRIIATTNKDLEQEVVRQTFREDLYFRLNVVGVYLPSLRDRPQDIPALAEHFIEKYRWESGRSPRQLSAAALAALMAHDWPGNVRELENTIHRALVLTTDAVIGVKALEVGPPSGCSPRFDGAGHAPRLESTGYAARMESTGYAARMESTGYASGFVGRPLHLVERDAIIGTLQLTAGNRTRTALMLGLSIRALRNKISLYSAQGIDVPPSGGSRVAAAASGTP